MDLSRCVAPICPHCGKEYGDAWELGMHDGDQETVDCGHCEKGFVVECEVSVTYSTRPLPSPPEVKL